MGKGSSPQGNSHCGDWKAFKMFRAQEEWAGGGRRGVLGRLFRCLSSVPRQGEPPRGVADPWESGFEEGRLRVQAWGH